MSKMKTKQNTIHTTYNKNSIIDQKSTENDLKIIIVKKT